MELNLHIIKEDLSPWCREGHLADGPNELSCTHPLLYVRGMDFFVGPVYIAQSEDLPREPPAIRSLNLICIGSPPEGYLKNPFNVLIVDEGKSGFDVLSKTLVIYDRYGECCRRMERIVEERRTLKELGEVAALLLNNPVNLWSPGFKDLFYITSVVDERDNVLHERLDDFKKCFPKFRVNKYLPSADLLAFASDSEFGAISGSDLPILYEGTQHGFPCRALIYAIGAPQDVVAYLIVDEVNHLITSKDVSLSVLVGGYVKRLISLCSLKVRASSTLGELAEDLIAHKSVERGRLEEELLRAGWDIHDEYRVLVMGAEDEQLARSNLRALNVFVAEGFECVLPATDGERIVLVVNESRAAASVGRRVECVIEDLASIVRVIGASESFRDFEDIRNFYDQACAAIELGGADGRDEGVLPYADYYVRDMIRRCEGDRSKESLMPGALRRLMRNDQRDGTAMVHLLGLYLDNNLNVSQTSRAAYMHRNTCMSKLGHISDVLSLDLDDPDVILGLKIAMKILSS